MTDQQVCLTLIVPRQLREEMFDYLAEQSDIVSGFTASRTAGHGGEVRLYTAAERVQGHADQAMVQVILAHDEAVRLLDRIRGSFAGTRLVYWTTPVTEFGIID
ncbi:DUF3240 family protein [Bradyrhizobium arachidis]|uniref:DUF3240 family protein n=1 Tax=Bradyrhizobium TaxID=374 RepID=UPI00188A8D2A|nr:MULTISPECIES: DUF3240 family protein [Bradyrhizobium]MDN4982643.1 DUF3240 family protein [Bradyrhizobium sp. WYCCWR 13022]QOZ53601.1 DUF3240 domain-containing protein [Bradyrhizobium sp. CCBAU 53338]UVO34136.1 DUF3240 family protein [Bradyrhizobium arachidis]